MFVDEVNDFMHGKTLDHSREPLRDDDDGIVTLCIK